jgi:hypothetical protein
VCTPLTRKVGVQLRVKYLGCATFGPETWIGGRWRRSECARLVLEGGVRLRVKYLGPRYVRAKNIKCATTTLKNWRFKTRFFASFLCAFAKK